ncbi:MAG: translation initiation factor IF-2 [Desulfobacteraceae bacterium]|nr:translation initiation factor IF-2 [Desulfobacteraceae bacterium]
MSIRVYELAKELNMTNKALLDKIIKMGDIEVKSHMSSLDSESIETIKTRLLGKPNESDEKRVKPTVIRRRKKNKKENPADSTQEDLSETSNEDESDEPVNEEAPESDAAELKETTIKSAEESEPDNHSAAKDEDKTEKKAMPEKSAPEKTMEKEVSSSEKKESQAGTKEKNKKKKSKGAAKIIFRPDPPVKKEPEKAPEPIAEEPAPEEPKQEKNIDAPKVSEVQAETQKPLTQDEPKKPEKGKKEKVKIDKEEIFKDITPPEITPEIISDDDDEIERADKLNKGRNNSEEAKKPKKKKRKPKKKEVVEGDELYESAFSKKPKKNKKGRRVQEIEKPVHQKTQITVPKAIKRRIKVDETIVLSDLAKRMGIKANEMIAKLMGLGVMATVNQTIDYETAELVAGEFGFEVEKASFEEETLINVHHDSSSESKSLPRPPVVTVMGHVDHGKTSLLDVIRKTGVAEGEAGGITQHIGAYIVSTESGDIAFLDTPGHEAFTAMRSRGAKVTDIVVLVVAADDGVMPQTVEAINHAKAAQVPIVVAVNKIDKPGAEPDVVKRELSEHGILPEDWGGDTIFVNVSAKQKIGIEELLEMILLQSEILDLKADPDKFAKGHVIEARLDTGRGPVASVLVQEGTLKLGDAVVCGTHYGKVRAMFNDQGEKIESAGPSIPIEILGLNGVPEAGDELIALKDEKDAKQVGEHRAAKQRSKDLAKSSRMSLEGLFEKLEHKAVKDLNLIIKADVQGSIEALKESLGKLSTDEVKIKIVHAATGTVSESDISLATVSDAIILGFNVRPAPKVRELAEEENIDMKFYNVIYDAIKDIENAMVGLMDSTYKEVILGTAEVRAVFSVPKIGKVAGCFVTNGMMKRGKNTRILRDGVIIFDGQMSSLKRYKDDVREVNEGYECGIGIEKFNDIKEGDTIECYMMEEIKPTLG